ncbi:hypothetical protein GCM10017608_06350 [Agromyces luteolus]|uniref:Uncharacterized protein n=1 Tax=Agromyces luteolus TaxID=88373 RepID=A0A7C9HGH2_9MICO|nr:hypothetical protein [Agromyces luteolus]MUN06266.1 hypothetical protein [Agromyces luteolus]GLK26703.1 hypothetical protein GCM10017608_06350 [Agromyces luteolus]
MLFGVFFVLTFPFAAGFLIFLIVWSIRRARQGGRSAIIATIGIWAAAGVLTGLAGTAWYLANWRSAVSASPPQLTGRWSSESSDGRATIELRRDGSAVVEGVPSDAAWTFDWMDETPDLPAVLDGHGTWEGERFGSVELSCADGRDLRLLWHAVESPTGTMYLQFIAGDPDAPEYFGEFSKVDDQNAPDMQATTKPAC